VFKKRVFLSEPRSSGMHGSARKNMSDAEWKSPGIYKKMIEKKMIDKKNISKKN